MSRIDLTEKPIVIAGASSGIGAATAVACARVGMPVLLCARRYERVQAGARSIQESGGNAYAMQADVTKHEDCVRMIEQCTQHFGPPYSVFANAGSSLKSTVLDTTDEQLRSMYETNLFGTWNVVRAALPGFVERARGHVLVCSSSIGKFAIPSHAAYCGSKAAQWPLAHAIQAEYSHLGVHASSIHPIGTKTEIFQSDDDLNMPKSRMHTPDRVARSIVAVLQRPKLEVWPSRSARGLAAAATLFPGLFSIIQRQLARKHREQAARRSHS